MADAPNPADLFSWRMVDGIRYCADLAEHAKGGAGPIERARAAASQLTLILPPRSVETLEIAVDKRVGR